MSQKVAFVTGGTGGIGGITTAICQSLTTSAIVLLRAAIVEGITTDLDMASKKTRLLAY
jgi:NAD(P)-dependent dehydrogenase (short-subunit alcohol dehydrogenase family)